MNTFYQMWGVKTPEEAVAKIEEQKSQKQEFQETLKTWKNKPLV